MHSLYSNEDEVREKKRQCPSSRITKKDLEEDCTGGLCRMPVFGEEGVQQEFFTYESSMFGLCANSCVVFNTPSVIHVYCVYFIMSSCLTRNIASCV